MPEHTVRRDEATEALTWLDHLVPLVHAISDEMEAKLKGSPDSQTFESRHFKQEAHDITVARDGLNEALELLGESDL